MTFSIEEKRIKRRDYQRHRIILSYEAEAEEITTEDIIQRIYESVPTP